MPSRRNQVYSAGFINTEPVIFLGCTSNELTYIAVVSVLLSVPVCAATGLLTGSITIAAAAAAVGSLAFCCCAAQLLRFVKRDKPPGHYQLRWLLLRAQLGINCGLVVRSGRWGIGKSLHGAADYR